MEMKALMDIYVQNIEWKRSSRAEGEGERCRALFSLFSRLPFNKHMHILKHRQRFLQPSSQFPGLAKFVFSRGRVGCPVSFGFSTNTPPPRSLTGFIREAKQRQGGWEGFCSSLSFQFYTLSSLTTIVIIETRPPPGLPGTATSALGS